MQSSLSEGVKFTKYLDPDKYSYSGYGVSFDVPLTFSLPNGGFVKNLVIFGADKSLSVDADN